MVRVGVTGHRDLADPSAVAVAVDDALDGLLAEAGRAEGAPPALVVVSSLAEGADRLVARAVLARGGRLEAVLPLDPDDYGEDFDPTSGKRFRALLARADEVVVAPSGVGDGSREDAYLAAGHAVVDRCDVLLALWDGLPARGRGGTAEVVAYARGLPRRVIVVPVVRRGSGGPPSGQGT